MAMTLGMETPYLCLLKMLIRSKNMFNGKVVDATLMTIDLLKWRRPQTSQWITTITDQPIKQGFPNN